MRKLVTSLQNNCAFSLSVYWSHSRWCLVSPLDRCELGPRPCYIAPQYHSPLYHPSLYQIAVTCSGGEGSHSKPDSIISWRTTQTARSPHPADNFCQILLARQETHDGEGQWSRRGRRSLRRSKSSGDVASGSLLQPSENWMWVGGTNMKTSATIKIFRF